MAVFVQITDASVETGQSGVNKAGKAYTIPDKQKAWLHQGEDFPTGFKVPVPEGKSPYKPGFYVLKGMCFEPGEYGLRFQDRGIELQPLEEGIAELSGVKAPPPADKGK